MAVTVFGWTQREWGIAIKQLGYRPQNLREAANMREHWRRQGRPTPGSVRIIGADYSADLEAAGDVLRWAKRDGVLGT